MITTASTMSVPGPNLPDRQADVARLLARSKDAIERNRTLSDSTQALAAQLRSTLRSRPHAQKFLDAREPLGFPPARVPRQSVTARQWEVACLVARGCTNREIAEQLVVTEGTVANHVAEILDRLSLRSRAEVAVWVTIQIVQESGLDAAERLLDKQQSHQSGNLVTREALVATAPAL